MTVQTLIETKLKDISSQASIFGIEFQLSIENFTDGYSYAAQYQSNEKNAKSVTIKQLLETLSSLVSTLDISSTLSYSVDQFQNELHSIFPDSVTNFLSELDSLTFTLESATIKEAKRTSIAHADEKNDKPLKKEESLYQFSFSAKHEKLKDIWKGFFSFDSLLLEYENKTEEQKDHSKKTEQTMGLGFRTKILNQPFTLSLSSSEGETYYKGITEIKNTKISSIFKGTYPDLYTFTNTYIDELFGTLQWNIIYEKGKTQNVLSLKAKDSIGCTVIEYKKNTAIFINIPFKAKEGSKNKLLNGLDWISKYMGIQAFVIFSHAGDQAVPKKFFKKESNLPSNLTEIPKKLSSYQSYVYTMLDFEQNTLFCNAVSKLLGIKTLDFFYAHHDSDDNGTGIIRIPNIQSKYLSSENLYFQLDTKGNKGDLTLSGDFVLPFIPSVTFYTNSSMTPDGFVLSATANIDPPVTIYESFQMKDAGLLIGYQAEALTFGILANLFLGDLSLFGAFVLKYQGAFQLSMINAAMSPCTLDSLLSSFLGKDVISIPGLEEIAVDDFTLEQRPPKTAFDASWIATKDSSKILNYLNESVSFIADAKLEPSNMELANYDNGLEIIDQKHLRHYFLSKNGNISMRTQFYCSLEKEKMQFGAYTLEPGIFICGVIQFFGLKVETVFSIKKDSKGKNYDEILAFAHIEPCHLGPISINSSKFSKDTTPISLPKDNALHQFLKPNTEGAILYMLASKKKLDFFFDLGLKILFYELDARIVYTNGLFELQTTMQTLLCSMTLKISADYTSLSKGNFAFSLELDPTVIQKNLLEVHKAIQDSLTSFNGKVKGYENQLAQSRTHVNDLNNQIQYLRYCIQGCIDTISRARWWEKVYVTIVKGAEIAAYEVAIAGVYTAICAANAAIDIAVGALKLTSGAITVAGEIESIVSSLATTVLESAFKVFSVSQLTLSASANSSLGHRNVFQVKAGIQYSLLGQSNSLSLDIQLTDAATMLKDLCSSIGSAILGTSQSKLAQLADGQIDKLYQSGKGIPDIDLSNHEEDTTLGLQVLTTYQDLILDLCVLYYEEFGTPMPESDNLIAGFMEGLTKAQNSYELAKNLNPESEIMTYLDELNKAIPDKIPDYFDDYISATGLQQSIENTIHQIPQMQKNILDFDYSDITQTGSGNMDTFLEKTSRLIKQKFSQFGDQDTFINLENEIVLHEMLAAARKEENPNYQEPVRLKKAFGTSSYTSRFGGDL